jgi:hypothetical protein
LHKSAAFWERVPSEVAAKSISIPKSQRLTVDTLDVWHADFLASYTKVGAS